MTFKKMIQEATFQRLRANWDQQQPLKGTDGEIDFIPICKLFNPCGAATWLLTECDEDGLAFGLCDLGFGTPRNVSTIVRQPGREIKLSSFGPWPVG